MSWSDVFGALCLGWFVYFLVRLARWERSGDRLLKRLKQEEERRRAAEFDEFGLRRFGRAKSLKAGARDRARKSRARKARRR